ncbi:hypothetical protein POVCU1_041090 [Plasmodium ovale curtisi]|uniref:Uncharacterized protein n=1 Tax=Plasmodium ovale curtisi TaxID=864141 RepID=A0A1A8X260_PLAOA|nr:hypothetical protein POVCU1_041090 [Plasmodium ovale curtisi]
MPVYRCAYMAQYVNVSAVPISLENVPLPMLRSNGETLEPLLSLLPLQLRQVENELLENYVSGKTILERTKK